MPSRFSTLKISRSGLKLFLECPRCFWLDLHHKIKRPPSFPYTLASAVDYLVKLEFDKFRKKGELPPVLKNAGITDAKLFNGDELPDWRNNFKGISYYDESQNAILYGAVDDILEYSDGSLAVIDYKSSGSREITIYDDYQKQMDTYNYILQQLGHQTYPEAYFVFYQVIKEGEKGFKNALKFKEEVRPVKVKMDWVGPAFEQAVETSRSESVPESRGKNGLPAQAGYCDHCHYVAMASKHSVSEDINI